MRNFYLIFSHKLTDVQIQEIKNVLKCSNIVEMPDNLKNQWSAIPPEGELDKQIIKLFTDYLDKEAREEDYVLVSGEFGMTYAVVSHCFDKGLIPVYAASKRINEERINSEGEVEIQKVFRHVNFRRFPR